MFTQCAYLAANCSVSSSSSMIPATVAQTRNDETVLEPVVLVVDDDDDSAFIIAELLRARGIPALSSSDPLQVVEDFSSRPLRAIIVDLKMPGMSGPQLLAKLRLTNPKLPAILLTGYALDDPKVVNAMESGNVAYLAKSVSGSTIASTLRELVQR